MKIYFQVKLFSLVKASKIVSLTECQLYVLIMNISKLYYSLVINLRQWWFNRRFIPWLRPFSSTSFRIASQKPPAVVFVKHELDIGNINQNIIWMSHFWSSFMNKLLRPPLFFISNWFRFSWRHCCFRFRSGRTILKYILSRFNFSYWWFLVMKFAPDQKLTLTCKKFDLLQILGFYSNKLNWDFVLNIPEK